ncbi:MAG: sensor histidine kinase [Gemmatimonadaceae bacterium]
MTTALDEADVVAFDPEEALKEKVDLRRAVLMAVGACVLVGVLETAKDLTFAAIAGRERALSAALRAQMPWWILWMAFMPAVLWLARRFRFDNHRWPRSAAVHVVLGLLIALSHGVLFSLVFHRVTGVQVAATLGGQVQFFLGRYLFTDIMTYCATIGIYWSVEYFTHFRVSALAAARSEARAARLQLRLAEARIHALRMELNPHFLFNALNSVAGLVRRREHDAAIDMLARLGELLRTTLNRDMPSEVTLAEELALLRRFLDIELVRFGDRLRVVWEIEAETYDAFVPPLILQPLVENALRHGIARRSGAGLLHITARRAGLNLELVVRDSGEGLGSLGGRPPREGIGLANTRARLEELYGAESASVDLADANGGGARARLTLPLHMSRGCRDVALGA